MAVITISRQFGCGAEEIVEKICQALDYHPFGKMEITRAAFESGLTETQNLDYSEDNYKVKNFFDRLFKRSTTVAQIYKWNENVSGPHFMDKIEVDETGALALVQKAVKLAYQADNMVIVGRGGQVILKGLANTLHVRIEADLEDRILRVKNQLKKERGVFGTAVNVALRREVQDLLRDRDSASAGYIKQFYDQDWADSALYDLILNTSQMDLDAAAQRIIEKVQVLQPEH